MSDSATPFGNISIGQRDQVAVANGLFDALSPAGLYGLDKFNSSGLTLALFGGKISIAGVITTIAAYSGSLTASATNYVQASKSTGAVLVNSTGYVAGYWPIGRAVTDTLGMTTWYDDRFTGSFQPAPLLAKTLPSDANYTLTFAEWQNAIINISGTLTATRNIYMPLSPQQWTVYNGTGQSLQFIGATGTGVTVATLKRAIIYADGTNIVRVTADA